MYPADLKRLERDAAAAFRRLQKKAAAQLESSSALQVLIQV